MICWQHLMLLPIWWMFILVLTSKQILNGQELVVSRCVLLVSEVLRLAIGTLNIEISRQGLTWTEVSFITI